MSIKKYLKEQFVLHPSMMPSDVAKLCYQAAMGAEHLLTDTEGARRYFEAELSSVEERRCPMIEQISDDVIRIDLGAWKAKGLPGEWLFNMFCASACYRSDGKSRLAEYLSEAEETLEKAERQFSDNEWQDFVDDYINKGMPAIHHSALYRQYEKPSYRIVDARFLSVIPILEKISCKSDGVTVISFDGRAASGKSTLARILATVTGASIIKMDDFFLPNELRTEKRLKEAGGNIHYERFVSEILPYLRGNVPFEYGMFDCGKMKISGKRAVKPSNVRIVEGSYSQHPLFGDYSDISVFVTVSAKEQRRRILERNGEALAKMFADRWIPMEESYFEAFGIKEKSDIVISTD